MAVTLETTTKRFRGLSTDQKPGLHPLESGEPVGTIPIGSVFTEVDTGERYVWRGSWPWIRQEQTVETLLHDLIDLTERVYRLLAATHEGHEAHLWGESVAVDEL